MRTLISLLLTLLSTQVLSTTVITNANGYTFNNQGELQQFSAMAFEKGKVLAIGDNNLANQYPDATIKDVKGKALLPGLIDAHGHLLGLGANLMRVELRDTTSVEQAIKRVKQYAEQNSDLTWITGRGWNQELWQKKVFPTAIQLDQAESQRPVLLNRVDGHAAWANSKALRIAGIDDNTPDPVGGKIIRDANGKATGVLIDTAMGLVRQHIPKTSNQQLSLQLDKAARHLLSVGMTSMHDAGISKRDYDFYIQQAKQGKLPIRIYAMIASGDPKLKQMLKAGYINAQQDFLSIRSVKDVSDGALGSRGAALIKPYSDKSDTRGLLINTEETMGEIFDTVIKHKFQLNVHAIGDRANKLSLDKFAENFKRYPGSNKLRHRIEHAQVVSLKDIPRFKQLDILPSMQPTHATSDMNMALFRVGKKRLEGAYAWQAFLKQGSPLVFGSDFPVELANPFFGLHAAVTRQDRNNKPNTGWRAQDSITIEQAFQAFTINAAYAAHQENILGGLTPGKWADFILIDQDIFAIPAQDIWKTKVLETWLAGKKHFSAN